MRVDEQTGRRTEALPDGLDALTQLLGGSTVLSRKLKTNFDRHDLVVEGIPVNALQHLLGQLSVLNVKDVLGKTRVPRSARLSSTDSECTIRFVNLLLQAIEVMGTQPDAEAWMRAPAIGLNQRIPINLIATDAGARIVRDHLTRIDHGVYV